MPGQARMQFKFFLMMNYFQPMISPQLCRRQRGAPNGGGLSKVGHFIKMIPCPQF